VAARFINATWQYSKATYGDAFGSNPRINSIHHAGRHGGARAGYYVSRSRPPARTITSCCRRATATQFRG